MASTELESVYKHFCVTFFAAVSASGRGRPRPYMRSGVDFATSRVCNLAAAEAAEAG